MDEALIKKALGEGGIPLAKGIAKLCEAHAGALRSRAAHSLTTRSAHACADRGEKGKWVPIDAGMLLWHTDVDGFQYFKLLRISDGTVLLEEELYENFDLSYRCERTRHGSHQFHTFELEDQVVGACFNREADANEFKSKMPIMGPKPRHKLDSKEAKKAEAEAKKLQKEKEEREKREAKEREKREKREAKAREKREKTERARGGGEREMVIGAPTNFQHITHVGWDEAKGFQVRASARRLPNLEPPSRPPRLTPPPPPQPSPHSASSAP
jgi:hypothetical protein